MAVELGIYWVKKDDTFDGIARKVGLTPDALAFYNKSLADRNKIVIGQGLNVPKSHLIKYGFLKKAVDKVASVVNGTTESNYLTQPEPSQDMTKTYYGGRLVNQRTRVLLIRAASIFGQSFSLTQGSYNNTVAASAGTHDGGGVVDISVSGWSYEKMQRAVLALRKAGFAAWLRTPAQGFSYHIHACAIGDKQMAWLARSQVQSYFNRRDGLAGNRVDNTEHRWPNWADRYNQ